MKMGYYPTPSRVVEWIRKGLSFPREPFTVLDPCCGEGIALEQLVEGSQAGTYGVELDEYRAEAAQDRVSEPSEVRHRGRRASLTSLVLFSFSTRRTMKRHGRRMRTPRPSGKKRHFSV